MRGVDVNAATTDNTCAFHWACWQGQFSVCRWLRDVGAEWKAVNDWGCNAVHWAALQGNLPMCIWLRQIGLPLSLPNKQGHTALHKAAYKGHGALCNWLVAHTRLGPPSDDPRQHQQQLEQAILPPPSASSSATTDDESGAEAPLEWCVGLAPDAGGYTPSMIASEQGHADLAKWLQGLEKSSRVPPPPSGSASKSEAPVVPSSRMVLTGPLGKLVVED